MFYKFLFNSSISLLLVKKLNLTVNKLPAIALFNSFFLEEIT